jgi:amino acid transporter
MLKVSSVRNALIGKPRDPMHPAARRHIALIAFFAWIGLGADGLSSSSYGPEEAYLALGTHTHFGLYLALATALTVFLISFAYNQVIELFPNGGGGYKVTTMLIGSRAGLVSGSALIVDYVLTISISVASGVAALFSLLPLSWAPLKLTCGAILIFLLMILNLRGMKEAIKVLLPIFVGFVVVHVLLIAYGIYAHAERLPTLIPDTVNETFSLSQSMGWTFVISVIMLAYSQGGGTYTGLEAVSNNVNTLAEPRVRTGKWTMFYMAVSLAFTAAGILLLYMLWDVSKTPGQTLNAVTFAAIIGNLQFSPSVSHGVLIVVLLLEAGLLFVASNTGFLGGPAVLANMAADSWVPRQFRQLSSRLITQNGVLVMGVAALLVLIGTDGDVSLLVVLYSINVFLTFSLSLLGLCVYWWQNRRSQKKWGRRICLSITGFIVTTVILCVLIVEKFTTGGWVTLLITGAVVGICLLIKKHYDETREQMRQVDKIFSTPAVESQDTVAPALDPKAPTAVFLVGENRGIGMHTLLWVQRLFPNHFKNFVFLSVGEVDAQSFGGDSAMRTMQYKIENVLRYFVQFCHANGLAAAEFSGYGTDTVNELKTLTDRVMREYPNSVCFASQLIFVHDNVVTRWLHNQTALLMQRHLHLQGQQMVILPMKVG